MGIAAPPEIEIEQLACGWLDEAPADILEQLRYSASMRDTLKAAGTGEKIRET